MGEELLGLSTIWQSQNRHGDVKYKIGNGVAKELPGMTHRHEQSEGIA